MLKGESNTSENRRTAIRSFNAQNWSEAIRQFNALSTQDAESVYYSGMAMFYSKDYNSAITTFNNELLNDSVFDEEVRWYLGLAYILANQEEQGKQILKAIKYGEWNYEYSKELLK